MSKKQDTRTICDAADTVAASLNRRQFLGSGVALGAGGLLADLGLSRYAQAQGAATPPPAGGGGGPPRRPPPPLRMASVWALRVQPPMRA